MYKLTFVLKLLNVPALFYRSRKQETVHGQKSGRIRIFGQPIHTQNVVLVHRSGELGIAERNLKIEEQSWVNYHAQSIFQAISN